MSTQPNALRLADALHAWDGVLMMPIGWRQQTSEELRSQHELIQTLKDALETCRHVLSIEGCEYTAGIAIVALAAAEAHK